MTMATTTATELAPVAAGDPVTNVTWRHVSSLRPNAYNPNLVLEPELRLLEHSILTSGWLHALLVTPAGTIIDGFHRFMLSVESPALQARYKGQVPCVVLDIGEAEAKALTVRINRAKGSHAAARMSDLVKSLIDEHGWTPARVATEIGATRDEVDLLYQDSIFKAKNMDKYRYSHAWVPLDVKRKAVPGARKGGPQP